MMHNEIKLLLITCLIVYNIVLTNILHQHWLLYWWEQIWYTVLTRSIVNFCVFVLSDKIWVE